VLAVILTGKGIAALQEAGWLNASVITVPRVDLLGIYPSLQSVGAQLTVAALLALGFLWNARKAKAMGKAA